MSGHSKWSSIKHQKGKADAKRGKLFSRLVKEITMAARNGGGDPSMNATLRLAVDKANAANMPKDNIAKAIKRGTGDLPGVAYIESVYEGYGPGGVTVMVNVVTDNKNRIASEMRKIFSDHGGSMGETGCVNWMYQKKGYISIAKSKIAEDDLMEKVLLLDVEDLKAEDDDFFEIITSPENYADVNEAIKEFVEVEQTELTMIPSTYVQVSGNEAQKMIKLLEALDDNDDVQEVYTNCDIEDTDE